MAPQSAPQSDTLKNYIGERLANSIAAISGPEGEAALLDALKGAKNHDANDVTQHKLATFYQTAMNYMAHRPVEERDAILKATEIFDPKPGDPNPLTRSSNVRYTARQGLEQFFDQYDKYKTAADKTAPDAQEARASANEGFKEFRERSQTVVQEQFQKSLRGEALSPLHASQESPSPASAAPKPVAVAPDSLEGQLAGMVAQTQTERDAFLKRVGMDPERPQAGNLIKALAAFTQAGHVDIKSGDGMDKAVIVGEAVAAAPPAPSDMPFAVRNPPPTEVSLSQGVESLPPEAQKAALAYGMAMGVAQYVPLANGETPAARLDRIAYAIDPDVKGITELLQAAHDHPLASPRAPAMDEATASREMAGVMGRMMRDTKLNASEVTQLISTRIKLKAGGQDTADNDKAINSFIEAHPEHKAEMETLMKDVAAIADSGAQIRQTIQNGPLADLTTDSAARIAGVSQRSRQNQR